MLGYISMELDHGQLQLNLLRACRFDHYYSLPVPVHIVITLHGVTSVKWKTVKVSLYEEGGIPWNHFRIYMKSFILHFVLPKYCDWKFDLFMVSFMHTEMALIPSILHPQCNLFHFNSAIICSLGYFIHSLVCLNVTGSLNKWKLLL